MYTAKEFIDVLKEENLESTSFAPKAGQDKTYTDENGVKRTYNTPQNTVRWRVKVDGNSLFVDFSTRNAKLNDFKEKLHAQWHAGKPTPLTGVMEYIVNNLKMPLQVMPNPANPDGMVLFVTSGRTESETGEYSGE